MNEPKHPLTQDRVRALLVWHPGKGVFLWRESRGRSKAGTRAGRTVVRGGRSYSVVTVEGRDYGVEYVKRVYGQVDKNLDPEPVPPGASAYAADPLDPPQYAHAKAEVRAVLRRIEDTTQARVNALFKLERADKELKELEEGLRHAKTQAALHKPKVWKPEYGGGRTVPRDE